MTGIVIAVLVIIAIFIGTLVFCCVKPKAVAERIVDLRKFVDF